MEFSVKMTAFTGEISGAYQTRKVEVPDSKIREALKDNRSLGVLDLIFQYGQNDFQPQMCPSVSCGDVIVLYDWNKNPKDRKEVLIIIQANGFRVLTDAEFKEYEALPRPDKLFSHLLLLEPSTPDNKLAEIVRENVRPMHLVRVHYEGGDYLTEVNPNMTLEETKAYFMQSPINLGDDAKSDFRRVLKVEYV